MPAEHPHEQCTRWFDLLASRFPELSRSQVRTLALWSFAATITQHIASTTCAFFLARLFAQSPERYRQRLREFYWPAQQKPGSKRQELNLAGCFAPLLRWILSLYRADELPLALDVTLVRDRLAVISLSVVFRGSALPVAWKVLPANAKGAWIPCCQRLIEALAPAVPEQMTVLVLCDRGLQSQRLFGKICQQGWHPMMRLVRLGFWCEAGSHDWRALAQLMPGPGCYYVGRGQLFKRRPLRCTLIALWEEGYEVPWLLMTDLAPARCQGRFYGLRAWIEQGFRCLKSGAYHCERLRVVDPERAERVWLVLAVSLLWTHAVGSAAGRAEEPCGVPGRISSLLVAGVRRVLGIHRRGWIEILVRALRGEALPLPAVLFAWPRPQEPPGRAIDLSAPL